MFFAWISSILYGANGVFGKFNSKYTIKNPWLLNFFWSFIELIIITSVSLISGGGFPINLLNVLFAALFQFLSFVLYVFCLYKFDVSIMVPMFSLRSVFSIILSYLILHYTMDPYKYFLAGIIIIFGFFVNYDEKLKLKAFFKKDILLLMALMLDLASLGIAVNKSVAVNGYWTTTLWMNAISMIALMFTIPLFKKEVPTLKKSQLLSILGLAVISAVASMAETKAYSINVPVSALIISLPFSLVFLFLVSVFKPNFLEKNSRKVYAIRITAAVIMIGCTLLI